MRKYLLLIVFLSVMCCGKRGDPMPPNEEHAVPVSQLRVLGAEFDPDTGNRTRLMNRMVITVKPSTKTQ